ncbi:hypothetical protein KUCAC02_007735 [Chaenocephalus aceratus]|uniref:Uncharacterized protein n=1 Tax=Chaenocephalus aceratus TaxID=36190 RepID=A0ACB9X7Q7_CHAAC|nr:hypothetical protein KUCAC02_007735 [Chaenocephalus aceratus]
MATVRRSVLCSSCEKTFNRSVICNEYLIQLNRPIQCVCGCVLCTLCYREQEGCRAHNVSSQRGTVITTVSALASCPELENQGDWDLLLEPNDQFKTEREVNGDVRLVTNEEQAPDLEKLKTAYETLMAEKDSMSFKYWANEVMPLEMAHRYVCIPHLQGFWDHVLVGKCPPPDTDEMIAPDDHLPKLFNVSLGPYRFHWCCFVLKKQIVLAMWCTSGPRPKVLSLVDISLRKHTASPEFRSIVTYLSRWVTAQYVRPRGRQLKVVLDCKPSEGASLVHAVASLASKCEMKT